MDGRLEVQVRDPSGRGVPAEIELTGRSLELHAKQTADDSGHAVLARLPAGVYRLSASYPGFALLERRVEIHSAVPQSVEVVLQLESVATEVSVESSPPLFDPAQPSQIVRAGREQLDQTLGTTLGRSTVDVVTTMPGWLLEANAVLHPRGSEYDTQYVIDGMPLYDNRSLAFAPAFENSEFEAVHILTAGMPAEYGRRLGGVIALDTRRTVTRGIHTELDLQRGSYDTYLGSLLQQFATDRTVVSVGLQGGRTDRYLDPPSLDNFTNKAGSAGFHVRAARDWTERDRLTLYVRSNRTGFLVPNDLVQQAAGQRQDRRGEETAGQLHYQRTISSNALASVRGMVRDVSAKLWSNRLSTPVYAQQDRGFREAAALGDVTVEGERQTLKLGGDFRTSDIRELFRLAQPDELPNLLLDFHDKARSTEASLFVQDQVRFGGFAANVGLRFDRYRLLIEDHALSPRVALSYYFPSTDLQLRASYDRVFQPPPSENLLLSSMAAGFGIAGVEDSLPVPASRANFFEVGLRKPLAGRLRLDATHYWRTFRNSLDDDVFLNTGVSFPITFDTARVEGTEVRLEMPQWRGVSSFASYSNMRGIASSPVTGGLFIEGGDAAELRDVVERFAITQDQRNTVAGQIRFEPHSRAWVTAGARYGSGLPVELESDSGGEEEAIPPEILAKVDFERGRVRPNLSLDFSTGVKVWERDARFMTLQFDLRNATDRLNVINFSGLFSGTALAPGRQATVQLKLGL